MPREEIELDIQLSAATSCMTFKSIILIWEKNQQERMSQGNRTLISKAGKQKKC